MNQKTIIFIGPQGSGKGTQAKRLVNWLESDSDVLHFEIGDGFRSIAKSDTYTSQCMADTLDRGEIQPLFLAAYLLGDALIDLEAEASLVIDGIPRTIEQFELLDEALRFYHREVEVVHLQLPREESVNRLLDRGRHDDTESAINNRLDLYNKMTEPILKQFADEDRYTVHEIDGEQSMDAVETDIKEALT